MRSRLALLLLSLAVLGPATARAQTDEETEEASEDESEGQAREGEDGYEPDQRGYEPDQRGYEPDQRGNEEGGEEGGGDQAGGDETEYEPDQRGYDEEEMELAPEPTTGSVRVAAESDDVGYGSGGDYGAGLGVDLRLWLGGAGSVLEAFEGDNLLRESQRGGFGGSFGITMGLRVGQISVGPRVTVIVDGTYALATIGADVILRLLPERFSPYVRVALSYALGLSFNDSLPSQGNASGLFSELGVGLGGRVLGPMTLGVEVSGGWLALYRGAEPMCEAPCSDADVDLTRSGQAHGLVVRGLLWLGFEL